ncbi:type II toxin-antitoxin system RelB/DinJ family antitoxin [Levilactobacillus lanxiensis]|uniref:Type II toxin-antitoxin system RelB/DinJ family antitoxin n=1 Tax=Levilactobacillus lanxiensis TaxID=2799568 RepID=A0ABW4D2X4_9LACO|nr:type II toxin-antitoxin system RelB/DinJ family antitoxin [Levilactobacillus lanxiensis]
MKNMEKDRISIRVDHDRKEAAQSILDDLGLDLGTAINMFLAQTVREQALPFRPAKHPSALKQALDDVKNGDVTTFDSEKDFYKYLNEQED